jgi:FMN-dependent NADH-azoreductase
MSLFRLDTSIFPGTSASAELAGIIEAEWTAARPGTPVVRRDLGSNPLPADAWALAAAAGFVPEDQHTPAQREALALAATLAAELRDAEAVLLAVPLYNYGVSQHFKAWADLVIAGAGAAAPVLSGKPTVLATVRGGSYAPGTPREGWDHSTPYLKRILADLWEADLTIVERELTLAGVNPALDDFKDLAASLHSEALTAARDAGKALAARQPA